MAYEELEPYQRDYILKLEAIAYLTREFINELRSEPAEGQEQDVIDEYADTILDEINAAIPPRPPVEWRNSRLRPIG